MIDLEFLPEYWRWLNEARFGMFLHWGPYSAYGRGEQVLMRELIDQRAYETAACRWNPERYEASHWASVARQAGMKYAVLTSRHHDGYCLWDSQFTDYTSARQAAKRDFVREYLEAFRAEGLRVGLYYSLADFRVPAYFEGPDHDPEGWEAFRDYVHNQIRELLTRYGDLDVLWFDGAWPHSAARWKSHELVRMIRSLQPHLLVNNRLDYRDPTASAASQNEEQVGDSAELGDFGTPEHHITAESNRLWESCQVSTWRLWGYTMGERWRPTDLLLDMLVEAASKGGNLLLNVGPQPDGQLPRQFVQSMERIGRWLDAHGEAIYGTDGGDVSEFITYGRQTTRGNNLYLVIRFWDGRDSLRLAGLKTRVHRATLLTTNQELEFEQDEEALTLKGLPSTSPTDLFPVIRLECDGPPKAHDWAVPRLWTGDPRRFTRWAAARGTTVNACQNLKREEA